MATSKHGDYEEEIFVNIIIKLDSFSIEFKDQKESNEFVKNEKMYTEFINTIKSVQDTWAKKLDNTNELETKRVLKLNSHLIDTKQILQKKAYSLIKWHNFPKLLLTVERCRYYLCYHEKEEKKDIGGINISYIFF